MMLHEFLLFSEHIYLQLDCAMQWALFFAGHSAPEAAAAWAYLQAAGH